MTQRPKFGTASPERIECRTCVLQCDISNGGIRPTPPERAGYVLYKGQKPRFFETWSFQKFPPEGYAAMRRRRARAIKDTPVKQIK